MGNWAPEYPGGGRLDLTVPVADSRIGAIIGKKGDVINKIKFVCDVQIRVSNREDFVPGTRDRKVTISGTADAVRQAKGTIQRMLRAPPPAHVV